MGFASKLARLTDAGPGTKPRHQAPPGGGEGSADGDRRRGERIDRLRSLMNAVIARQQSQLVEPREPGVSLEDRIATLPGELRETRHGPVHVIEQILEPHHCHGTVEVARALEVDPGTMASLALDPGLGSVDPRRLLFLDTETTGLVGGTGTIPFLVGLGWFEDESLHLELLFLRRPGEEGPLLGVLTDRLERASCLVTYNGKSFDWPLLRTRFVMNRLPVPEPAAHLDLLHAARRVFKRRLGGVRLVTMEAEVLGFLRERDIDGAEVPGLYLDFLRRGDPSELAPVFEHNGHDIVALAAILAKLCHHFEGPKGGDDPRDHLGYAQVAERAKNEERALEFARAAARGGGDRGLTVDALLLEARLSRRRRDVGSEQRALARALDVAGLDGQAASPIHLALAKAYEHRVKDLDRALRHAAHTTLAEGEAASLHRVARLRRRLERAQDTTSRKGKRSKKGRKG